MHRSGAVFDTARQYRYMLWRQWNETDQMVAFVMLNPSTADAIVSDPTLRRCIGYATQWGFGGVYIVNLFAYRATDPERLSTADDPVGADNNHYILNTTAAAAVTVAACGNGGTLHGRDQAVIELIQCPLYAIGETKPGNPWHPLRKPADASLERWTDT